MPQVFGTLVTYSCSTHCTVVYSSDQKYDECDFNERLRESGRAAAGVLVTHHHAARVPYSFLQLLTVQFERARTPYPSTPACFFSLKPRSACLLFLFKTLRAYRITLGDKITHPLGRISEPIFFLNMGGTWSRLYNM